ncbi:unnamed protein product [Closterium sp. Yama58-4]|nr:unnamed protein product [Closterium sp. Yama58-4]
MSSVWLLSPASAHFSSLKRNSTFSFDFLLAKEGYVAAGRCSIQLFLYSPDLRTAPTHLQRAQAACESDRVLVELHKSRSASCTCQPCRSTPCRSTPCRSTPCRSASVAASLGEKQQQRVLLEGLVDRMKYMLPPADMDEVIEAALMVYTHTAVKLSNPSLAFTVRQDMCLFWFAKVLFNVVGSRLRLAVQTITRHFQPQESHQRCDFIMHEAQNALKVREHCREWLAGLAIVIDNVERHTAPLAPSHSRMASLGRGSQQPYALR